MHTVVQSKYLLTAVKRIEKQGHHIDLNERPMLSKKDDFKYNLKLFMYSETSKWVAGPAKSIGRLMKVDFVTYRIAKNK